MSKYSEKLKNPKWQKKRLQILERDDWQCKKCGDKENTLHIHHRYYERGKDPWDYDDSVLITLCVDCHNDETEQRPEYEYLLLQQLRKHFYADDLRILAWGFDQYELLHMENICDYSIAHFLSNNELRIKMLEIYFQYCDEVSKYKRFI